VVLNKVRATRGGQTLDQQQVVVMHIKGGKIAEVWLQFSDQQAMDEMASS
jgi:ketosteroid isomerase-like protein